MNFILRGEGSGGTLIVSKRLQGYYCGYIWVYAVCTMLCLAVRSSSSMIAARRTQKIFIYIASESGFKSLPWKFKLLLRRASAIWSWNGPLALMGFPLRVVCARGGEKVDGTLRYNGDLCQCNRGSVCVLIQCFALSLEVHAVPYAY